MITLKIENIILTLLTKKNFLRAMNDIRYNSWREKINKSNAVAISPITFVEEKLFHSTNVKIIAVKEKIKLASKQKVKAEFLAFTIPFLQDSPS